MDCSSPMSMKMLSKIPAWLLSCTGINNPHCNMYCSRPTVFRQTDFPPALGPEIMRIRCLSFSVMSNGTTFFPCLANDICSNGCTAAAQSMTCLSARSGFRALMSSANKALARMKSISAKNSYDNKMSGMEGRNSSEKSVRMRMISRRSSLSSSRIRLLASTTSAGSMNTVFPLADSSCTMPLIFRFKAGATGMTSRPSRMAGVTSLSTTPSDWALRKMLFSVREMLPIVLLSSRRIRANSGEALSLILPYGDRILLMRVISWGNTRMSSASLRKAG